MSQEHVAILYEKKRYISRLSWFLQEIFVRYELLFLKKFTSCLSPRLFSFPFKICQKAKHHFKHYYHPALQPKFKFPSHHMVTNTPNRIYREKF